MQWKGGETDYSKPGLLPREVVPRAFLLSEVKVTEWFRPSNDKGHFAT